MRQNQLKVKDMAAPTMQALVKTARGRGHVELKDMPVPEPGHGEVLIRVKAAGVCATDVHIQEDRFPNTPPMIMGHEFAGEVVKAGPGVAGIGPGDPVVSENNPFACATCRICQLGYPNMCPQKRAMGIHSDGCFADYVRLPANLLHRIPAGVTFEAAALSEPLAVAVNAVEDRGAIQRGDTVVVMGPGAIGLLAAQVARAEGAQSVLLVGTRRDEELRLSCARRMGLETAIVETDAIAERVAKATGGVGADMVIEASGARAAITMGITLLRRGGRMVVAGITGQSKIPVNWDGMVGKGLSLLFSYSSRRRNWDKALGYLGGGHVDTQPLITHRMKLTQWPAAFQALTAQQSIRTVFTF